MVKYFFVHFGGFTTCYYDIRESAWLDLASENERVMVAIVWKFARSNNLNQKLKLRIKSQSAKIGHVRRQADYARSCCYSRIR